MKKVLLIGDSIRLLYQPEVIRLLKGTYEVWGPADNGRFVKYSLNELERWITEFGKPDIIHWNNGLWDSAIVCEEDGAFTPVDEYVRYLKIMLRELRKYTGKVIFATTTPVLEASANQKLPYIIERNMAAVEFMKSENVWINDLYEYVLPHVEDYIGMDKIHLNAVGVEKCGQRVAEMICRIDQWEEKDD